MLVISTIGLQSCNLGASKTWKNNKIESRLRNEIDDLDKKVLSAINTNDLEALKKLMSTELLEISGHEMEELLLQVSNVMKSDEYQIIDQYHVENTTSGIANTVMSGISGTDDYAIQYQALNDEMFLSLIVPKNGLDEFLITNIYGKYPDGWRLNILQFGQYRINGKTATQLYQQATEEYEKGHLLDAANNMFLSSQVANPANKYWRYQKEDEMKAFYEKAIEDATKQFALPLTISEIESKPQIINVFPQGMHEGYFPAVEYLTTLDLVDTTKIKAENNAIHNLIGEIFKGIDQENELILYKAFNQMPDGKTEVPTYRFVKEN